MVIPSRYSASRWGLGALTVILLAGCSAVELQPRYGRSNSGPGGGFGGVATRTILVEYEATCDSRCTIHFSAPGVVPGQEAFEGLIRRNVRFSSGTARGVTMTVRPVEDSDVVKNAQIQVDGEVRAFLQGRNVQAGKTVSLTAPVLPRR
jgi:hypothetical protein